MTTMIAKFILPDFDNDGHGVAAERDRVLSSVLSLAGGYTKHRVMGAYLMADGSVAYDAGTAVSVLMAQENLDKLISILERFRNEAKQESVYLETSDATKVHFV